MKRPAYAMLALVLSVGFSFAADLTQRGHIVGKASVIAPYNWTGPYIGLNGGAGVGASGATATPFSALVPNDPADRMKGLMLGGQIGVRQQTGKFVFGLEADIDWTNIENRASACSTARRTFFATQLADTTSCQNNGTKVNWLSTVTASAGVTIWERVLLSVKGGLAFGEVKWDNAQNVTTTTLTPTGVAFCNVGAISCPNGNGAASESKTKYGWTLGPALEVALGDRWTAGGEVTYVNLGSTGGAMGSQKVDLWVSKARLNFRF